MLKYADMIIKGATVFAGIDQPKDLDFLAIKDKSIIARGKGQAWKEYMDENTQLIECSKEQLVVPGFHDSHLHLLMSALNQNYVDLEHAKSEEEAAQMVKEFADTIPEEEWVIGLNWYHMNWPKRELPTVKTLDHYLPERPVFLTNTEVHGAWVNSKALEIAGITKDSENPEHGEIFRFVNGEPTGYLNEMAMGLVGRIALKFKIDREKELIQSILRTYSENGVTSVQDMRPELGYILGQYETFYELEKENKLNVRIHSAASLMEDIEEIKKDQQKYNGDKFRICLLKQYLDGVPTTHTAMVTVPYKDAPTTFGEPVNDVETLRQQVLAAHRNGLSVKIHCCGDGAVKQALDFYEEAWKTYGDTGARHAVEHAEIIRAEDIKRFKQLHVIASMQPEHMVAQVENYEEYPYLEMYTQAEMERAWIIGTLLAEGVTVAFGTDNPVVGINPMMGIYRAVTRQFNDNMPVGGMNPQQKISVEAALHCYTYHSAFGVHREHELGTLEVGKYADMAILDQNILTVDPEQIKTTKVLATVMDGKVVYQR